MNKLICAIVGACLVLISWHALSCTFKNTGNSVGDYGATCNGSTNDSAAFTNALNSGHVAYVPRCSRPYVIATAVVHSTSLPYQQGGQVFCEPGAVIDNRVANGPAFQFTNAKQGKFQRNVSFENCEVTTTTSPPNSSVIQLTGVEQFHIAHNYFHNMTGSGILLVSSNGDNDGVQHGTIEHNIFRYLGTAISGGSTTSAIGSTYIKNNHMSRMTGDAIALAAARQFHFVENTTGFNGGYGIHIISARNNSSYSLSFIGGEIDDSRRGGLYIESAYLVTIDDLEITRSTNPGVMPFGIKLGGATGSVDIRVPRFRIDYNAGFTAINISSAATGVRITNPLFYM